MTPPPPPPTPTGTTGGSSTGNAGNGPPPIIGGGASTGGTSQNNSENNSNTQGRRGRRGGRGRGGRGQGGDNPNNASGTTGGNTNGTSKISIHPEFKDDGTELGVLRYQCYDSTSTIESKKRYTETTRLLQEYVGEKYKEGTRIRNAISTKTIPTVPPVKMPQTIDSTTNKVRDKTKEELTYIEEETLKYNIRQVADAEHTIKEGLRQLYHLVLGRCTKAMRAEIEAHDDYETAHQDADALKLLGIIASICHDVQDTEYKPLSVFQTGHSLFTMKQRNEPA